jgi:hypothetical protein
MACASTAQRSNDDDARLLGSQLEEERADTEAGTEPKGAKKQICFIGRLREGRLSSLIGRQALSYEKERDVVTGVLSSVLDLWGVNERGGPPLAEHTDGRVTCRPHVRLTALSTAARHELAVS